MRNKNYVVLTILTLAIVLSIASSVNYSQGRYVWREFSIKTPEEISTNPGDTITVQGEILNTGWWWLHDFDLSLQGLPENFEYSFEPKHFDDVRILREWNPEQGLYRVPEKFTLTVKVPADAAGLHLANITGQEHQSARMVSNSTYFILKILGKPEFSLTDIVIPEYVQINETFNISMDTKNNGTSSGVIKISLITPEDWKVDQRTKDITVKSNSSEHVVFMVTPTNTSGQISIFAEYPYQQQILNITKIGPLLIPQITTTTTIEPGIEVSLSGILKWMAELPLWAIAILLIVLIIIIWKLYDVLSKYKFKIVRSKPEEMVENKSNDIAQTVN